MSVNESLIDFIEKSPSVFHAVSCISSKLESEGFTRLYETKAWDLKPGKYYVTRNSSSIIAFDIPDIIKDYHFQLCASHCDSPTYKLKAIPEIDGPGEYLRLDVEGYGGMIDYSWLDKPLSVAGRVLVKENGKTVSKLLYIDRDILLIPSICIHMNRDVNRGYAFNRAVDLCPLFSAGALKKGDFVKMLADSLGVNDIDISSFDLYLVNRQEGKIWEFENEFISSPKLDDLQAAYSSLEGYLSATNPGCINVYVCYDNEEVGSGTKQGAKSTFLRDVLSRINDALGKTASDIASAQAGSFMVSFDNAHAVHPNHPELSDSQNRCYMNKGIVVKENAAQNYTTDAFSRAVFSQILEKAQVPMQSFANRSDLPGGGTLGNISNIQFSLHTVDIGIAQLAMHSSYETAGSMDTEYAIKALKEFYSSMILIADSDSIEIK